MPRKRVGLFGDEALLCADAREFILRADDVDLARWFDDGPASRLTFTIAGATDVDSGGPQLAEELEDGGYDAVRERLGLPKAKTAESTLKPSDFFTDTPFDI